MWWGFSNISLVILFIGTIIYYVLWCKKSYHTLTLFLNILGLIILGVWAVTPPYKLYELTPIYLKAKLILAAWLLILISAIIQLITNRKMKVAHPQKSMKITETTFRGLTIGFILFVLLGIGAICYYFKDNNLEEKGDGSILLT